MIALTIVVALVSFLFGYGVRDLEKTGNSTSPQTTNPASQPSPQTPSRTAAPSNLEECLKQASNSEAQQSVIQAGLDECHRQYSQ